MALLRLSKPEKLAFVCILWLMGSASSGKASFSSVAFVLPSIAPSTFRSTPISADILAKEQWYRLRKETTALCCSSEDDGIPEETTSNANKEQAPVPSVEASPSVDTASNAAAGIADSLHGRLLCASTCAYYETKDLQTNPYLKGAGYLQGTSLRRLAYRSGLDACLVGKTVDGIVVAFRGTSGNALEWLQNASIYLRRVPKSLAPRGCRVHEGFYGALKGNLEAGVKRTILELLEEEPKNNLESKPLSNNNNETKIYVTGHSKGGSLATLFALMLHKDPKFPSPEFVCSFGAAKVGNLAFGTYFDSVVNQTTYENDLDIIPFLPPGETTMEDIETATEDPEAMMEMIESILGSETKMDPATKRWRLPSFFRRGNRKLWDYNPVGKRTYIDPSGRLLHPITRDLDVQRIQDLEGTSFKDLRRAHCSSCSDDQYDAIKKDNDSSDSGNNDGASETSTCGGGYFAALAPEICDPSTFSSL